MQDSYLTSLNLVNTLLQTIKTIVFPNVCPECKTLVSEDVSLCIQCWRRLHFISPPFCKMCAYPLDVGDTDLPLCGRCCENPLDLEDARAAVVYSTLSKSLIMRYKHGDALDLLPLFIKWLQQAGQDLIQMADLLAPIPLHPWRLLQRGYNQAALLSNALSKVTGIPTYPNLLKRLYPTKSQGHLSPQARIQNLKGVFAISLKYQNLICDQHILLIDDVMTSGATLNECAKLLKKYGAKTVSGLVISRAIL